VYTKCLKNGDRKNVFDDGVPLLPKSRTSKQKIEISMNMIRIAFVVVIANLAFLTSSATLAQNSIWNGGPSGTWNSNTWTNGIPGVQTNATAVFSNFPGLNVISLAGPVAVPFNGINASNGNLLDLRLNGLSMTFTSSAQLSGSIVISSNAGGTGITSPTFAFTGLNLELKQGGTLTANSVSSSATGTVTLSTGGTLNLNSTGVISLPSVVYVFNGGTLNSAGTYQLNSGQSLSGYGALNSRFTGLAASNLAVSNGNLLVGSSNPDGFATSGNVTVASGRTLQVNDSNFATFGGNTQLQGGTIENVNSALFSGIAITSGATLTGYGLLNGRVTADVGSTIVASGGNLTIGDASKLSFFSSGDLHTGDQTVTLRGTNRATLGSVTSLGNLSAGVLVVDRGALVDFGRVLVGHGTVDSINTLANAMIINGDVIGNSTLDRITFDGYVKGMGTFENVTMNGTFAPGLSPSLLFTNNLALGNSSVLEMEIGGLVAGTEHDKLIDSGMLQLDGTLKLVLFNGYVPVAGDSFDLLDWTTFSGGFSDIDLSQAVLSSGLSWDLSNLYSSGVVNVAAVPEPTSFALLATFGIVTLVSRVRQSRVRA